MFKWLWTIFSLGAPDTWGIFSETGELFQSRLQEVFEIGKENKEIICFLLAVQSALLFNMIILSKGVKGFLIK